MKVVRTVILSLILVFLAFVIYRAAKGGRKIPASTIRAEYRDIESKLTIPGVIQPSKEIDIKSTISGVLEKLLVQVGDEVVGRTAIGANTICKRSVGIQAAIKGIGNSGNQVFDC